jgi:hypothetical protein
MKLARLAVSYEFLKHILQLPSTWEITHVYTESYGDRFTFYVNILSDEFEEVECESRRPPQIDYIIVKDGENIRSEWTYSYPD